MAWFRRTTHDPAELEAMKSDIQVLRNTIEAHDRRRREAAAALSHPEPPPAPIGPDEATQAAQAAAADRLDELAAKLAELDARVTAVSTELANQVTELGHDIEALSSRPGGTIDEAVLGELRDGQTRLASEQARYQIAFREDLARLADQFRRPGH